MASYRKILAVILPLFISAILCGEPVYRKCVIKLTDEEGSSVKLNTEIADTGPTRENGLMFRRSMPETDGMLFVFDKEQKLYFWMKNTYIPLDIAYIDKNGIIKEIYHMKPLDASVIYNSINPVMFALETNLGWFSRHRIKTGSKIEFNGCLSKQNSIIKR